jgi:hypothetical protein
MGCGLNTGLGGTNTSCSTAALPTDCLASGPYLGDLSLEHAPLISLGAVHI